MGITKIFLQVIVHRVVSWSVRQVGWDLYIHNKSFTLRRKRECKRVEIRCKNEDLSPHEARVLERNKGGFSWYNSRGWTNYSWVLLG